MTSKTLESVQCPTILAIHGIPKNVSSPFQECRLQTMSRDIQNDACQTATSTSSGHHSHSQILKPCEQLLTGRELIEVWSQALIQRKLARKRLAFAEEAFDDYAFEISHIIGPTQHNQLLEKHLNVIQRAGTSSTTMK